MAKRTRKLAVVNLIINTLDIMDDLDEPVHKRGKDRKWIKEREEKGAYQNIIRDLSLTDLEGFRLNMRMNYEQFIQLAEQIAPLITKQDTIMRKAISPKERLALTLRFLPPVKVSALSNSIFA